MALNPIILTSSFHDPELRLKKLIISALPKLKTIFKKIIVVLTPYMNEESIEFLQSKDIMAIKCPTESRVDTYKLAYKIALDYIENERIDKIMYIDFDRLIHWIANYPDELQKILSVIEVDYLLMGRSLRAFDTHPDTQKDTEIIVNEFGSKILDFDKTIDIISVCNVMTKELAIKILEFKNKTTFGFYCIWPILLWKWAGSKNYVEVEGLEWETPDRYKEDIDKIGYDEWLNSFLSSSEWRIRVKLLHECLIELLNLTNINLDIKKI